MKRERRKMAVVYVSFLFLASSLHTSQVGMVHNTLREIQIVEGKLKLTLVREWGGLETKDAAQTFFEPSDIELGKDDLFYVLDKGNSRIQVFDETGKFFRTIGREGKGPGEFTYPVDVVIDSHNNLVISESMGRVQILNSEGVYKKGFIPTEIFPGNMAVNHEGEIFLYNGGRSSINTLFLIYNYDGNIVRKMGNPEKEESPYLRSIKNSNHFSLDSQDNLCVGYLSRALLEKYTKDGELSWQATYEVPFKVPEVRIKGRNVESKMVSTGLSVDDHGRIYLATLTREKYEKERKVGRQSSIRGRSGSYSRRTIPHDIESSTTDLYQILVFNGSGKIMAAQRLDVWCNKIKVYKDRLFVIDSYVASKIYEYAIRFE